MVTATLNKLEANVKLIINRAFNREGIVYLKDDAVNLNLVENLGQASDTEFAKLPERLRDELSLICLYSKTKYAEATFRVYKHEEKGYLIKCSYRGIIYNIYQIDTWKDALLVVDVIEKPHHKTLERISRNNPYNC